MTAPLLSARRLSFRYGEREVLREVDLATRAPRRALVAVCSHLLALWPS